MPKSPITVSECNRDAVIEIQPEDFEIILLPAKGEIGAKRGKQN